MPLARGRRVFLAGCGVTREVTGTRCGGRGLLGARDGELRLGWLWLRVGNPDASPYRQGFAIVMRPTRNLPCSGCVRVAE